MREINRDAVVWKVDIGRSLVGTMQYVIFLSLNFCYAKSIGWLILWFSYETGLSHTISVCVRPRKSSFFLVAVLLQLEAQLCHPVR